jgi:hypothetical protein
MDKLQEFVIWLDGYIEAIGEDNFNVSKSNVIRNKLNGLFEHEADKLEDKPTLQELGEKHGFEVHEGLPESNNPFGWMGGGDSTLYRC